MKKAHPLVVYRLPEKYNLKTFHSIRKANLIFPDDFLGVKNWGIWDTA